MATASVDANESIQWLFDLYDRMLGDVDLPTILQDVAAAVCRDRDAERASVYLVDEATQQLESVAVVGNIAQRIRVPLEGPSLAGYCAKSRRAFVVPDAYGDLSSIHPDVHFDDSWDRRNNFRTRDVMCAPAVFKGDLVGVVQVINSRSKPFSNEDLATLVAISRLIGYALYHARIYDELATMKRLDKEKAAFMRVMVHELKSPVGAVKMMSDALISVTSDADEAVTRFADRIGKRSDQMLQLIQDLLELARVKAGAAMGDVTVLDLTSHVREAADLYQPQAAAKDLALNIAAPETRIPVRMDEKGCQLVLSNLISNAVKYTRSGSVNVSLEQSGAWATLIVRDTGMGIPTADLPKLFTEFFRASNAKKSDVPGTGVGLAGVKQIVERFDGQMELDSVENEGSTFTIRLPLCADA